MPIEAKVIADSISSSGKRITTLQLIYPRFIHSEFLTHRVFSRNSSSSRAIPVRKMLQLIRNDPAMPIHWGKDKPGMQATEEIQHVGVAKDVWLRAARNAAAAAEDLMSMGVHKQVANRLLEPFQHMNTIMTSTEFDNWNELRAHPDAQPEIQKLAYDIQFAMSQSYPVLLQRGEWHLPYVQLVDYRLVNSYGYPKDTLRKISAARCCRVSYLKHDGSCPTIEDDLKLCDRLAGAKPIHASPFEHQATPDVFIPATRTIPAHWTYPEAHGNFVGWIQNRKLIEQQFK